MTDDDWAPLPAADLALRPGESVDVPVRAVVQPPPAPPASPVPDPAAEAALAALQHKLRTAKPATSLLAIAGQAAHKAARKQRARANPSLQATVATIADDPTARPQIAYDPGADGRDEREESDWYRALPQKEQERLQRQWAEERGRFRDGGAKFRARMQRAAIGGACVMGLLGICQSLLLGGFGLVPVMAVAGAIAAMVAEVCRGDRFVYSLLGALAWVCVMGPVVLQIPFAMPGLLMAAYGMGAIGMEGEMRRSGGFRDR